MSQSLPQVAHDHHERILAKVNVIPELADALLTAPAEVVRPQLADLHAFLVGTLLPHIDAAERSLYPELERMFQNRHSMRPMRREHDEIRKLVGDFAEASAEARDGRLTLGKSLALRRVMFGLYALLKVHLAEEDAYLRIVDRGAGDEMGEVIAAALEHPVAG